VLMVFVHEHVIGRSRDEQITPDAIREAARKNAALIEKTIKGLNSGYDDPKLPFDVQMKVLRQLAVPKTDPDREEPTAAAIALPGTKKGETRTPKIVRGGKPRATKGGGSLKIGERKAECLADYALKEVKGDLTTYDMLKRDGFIANTAVDFAAGENWN
jgi:hypothetical protein